MYWTQIFTHNGYQSQVKLVPNAIFRVANTGTLCEMILIRVNLMYHRSLYYKGQCYVLSFQSNQTGTYPSHTHIHKIIPYVVACIPPYKGQSYLLSFQSNQPGMYPSHAHIGTYIWINLLMYALVLLYCAKQPFQVQLSRWSVAWPRTN